MNCQQGDIVWVEFPRPIASEPGKARPAIVVQSDAFNRSQLQTLLVVPLTSNLEREALPGNVKLRPRDALKKPSVASVTHTGVVDKSWVKRRMARASRDELEQVLDGVLLVLGRLQA